MCHVTNLKAQASEIHTNYLVWLLIEMQKRINSLQFANLTGLRQLSVLIDKDQDLIVLGSNVRDLWVCNLLHSLIDSSGPQG